MDEYLLFRLLVSHLVPLDDLAVAADTDRIVLAGLPKENWSAGRGVAQLA